MAVGDCTQLVRSEIYVQTIANKKQKSSDCESSLQSTLAYNEDWLEKSWSPTTVPTTVPTTFFDCLLDVNVFEMLQRRSLVDI